MATHNESGKQAEDKATAFLQNLGFHLVERNYRDRFCEIDIIVCNKTYIVFVEVKYRRSGDYGGAVAAVTPAKLAQMYRSAEYWLSQHEKYRHLQPRIDVITLTGDIDRPAITHIENCT